MFPKFLELPYLKAWFALYLSKACYDLKNEVFPIDRPFRRAETVTVVSNLKADWEVLPIL